MTGSWFVEFNPRRTALHLLVSGSRPRSLLLAELDKEEKEKEWYYGQLQNLTKRIDSLPLSDNVNMINSSTVCP